MSEVFRNYINSVRREFADRPLTDKSVGDNPYDFFEKWFDEAVGAEALDPFAMAIATVNKKGVPNVTVVYMRDITQEGIVFYTNYKSSKGRDLKENPSISANFFWVELDRQIRFTGSVEKVSKKLSDRYFAGRPRPSQLGAWASEQSAEIPNRETLLTRLAHYEKKFKGIEVPRPEYWGGFRIIPQTIEFWQGRPNRLHDRIVFYKNKENLWSKKRLAP